MSTEMQGWHPIQSVNTFSKLGDRYDDLIAANPYRNLTYNKSPWQNFLTSLGIRTQADAWKENMQVQAAEYDAGIAQMKFENEFNSPSAEASRMRQAGLNPDLQGLGDVAESAGMGEDPSTPMQTTGDVNENPVSFITQAANLIMGCATTGISLAKQFGDLRALRIANEAGEVQNVERATGLGKWIAEQFNYNPDNFVSPDGNPRHQFEQHVLGLDKSYAKFIPKRFRNAFRQSLYDFSESLNAQADVWNKSKEINDSKLAVARQLDSRYFGDGSFASMRIVNKELVSLSDACAEYILKSQKAESEYKSDYYGNRSGEDQAAADNAQASNKRLYEGALDPLSQAAADNAEFGSRKAGADLSKMMSEVTYLVNKSMSDMVHSLARQANRGDIFAQSMLFSFSLARMTSVTLGPNGVSFGINPQ